METLGIVIAAIVTYLAVWTYFDACRQRDALQIGVGPRNLAPEGWSALVFLFLPVALPFYFKARDEAQLQANPRSGAPPVFESRGLNLFGWTGLVCFLALAGWLAIEQEFLFAVLAVVPALVAAFGGRTIKSTDRTLKVDLPKGAAWEQVGFRPLPREEDHEEDADEEMVVNLDRLPPAAARPNPSTTAPPHVPAPVAPLPGLNIPSVSSYYPPTSSEPAAGAPAPAVLRISDITWAASEDDFDDGTSGPPAPGKGARPAVANADPALFQQLGGIFAPPGSNPPPGLPAARPAPPPAIPAAAPRVAPPLGAPSAPPPPFPPAAPPSAASRPAPPPNPAARAPRTAPPIAGAYASSRTESSSLPGILIGVLVLLGILAALAWWWRSRPVANPEPEPAAQTDPGPTAPTSQNSPGERSGDFKPANVPSSAGGENATLDQLRAWMSIYIELLGPAGQNLDVVDFEGFSPDRCAQLEQSLEQAMELPACPDEQIEFKVRSCLIPLSYLGEACHNQDVAGWCGHLVQARMCLHEAQIDIEQRWGLPGLVEFTINEAEPRPPTSISGRCEADAVEIRSREVDAAREES